MSAKTKYIVIAILILVSINISVIGYFSFAVSINATPTTAQAILNKAIPGDRIVLGVGVYNDLIVMNNGTLDNPIRIECASGASITGDNFGVQLKGNYIELSGCEVRNVREHAILNFGKHNIIENNVVHDNVWENGINGNCTLIPVGGWASAISIKDANTNTVPSSDDVIVRNNKVYHNCGEGIASTRTTNVVIENNLVYDNYGVNIYVDNSFFNIVKQNTVTCSNYVLRDEHLAYGIGTGQEFYDGWGQQLHHITISGNSVSGCFDGISIYATHGSTNDILVDGNMVTSCNRYAITNRAIVTNMVVSNNQICSNGNSFIPSDGVNSFGDVVVDVTLPHP